MRIVIAGASGLVGRALSQHLLAANHRVITLVRRVPRNENESEWNPANDQLDAAVLQGADAVVCLSGESIFGLRWTRTKKNRILQSRTDTAGLIASRMAELEGSRPAFICASATGYYGGNNGGNILTEDSSPGDDFLARVCTQWEGATTPASEAGARVVNMRIGMVLTNSGGALKTMLPAFRAGAGGRIGGGKQYMSWIALDDLVAAFLHVIASDEIAGPVNAVAPNPVTNREFTRALGNVLKRPTWFPVPSVVVRTALGEMGEALLLGSARVQPDRLRNAGFSFAHPSLDDALHHILAE